MAVTPIRAVLLTSKDDVAAVLGAVPSEGAVSITLSASGEVLRQMTARDGIPFGHKIAVRPIPSGQKILRYGYPIGVATRDIGEGGHVHSHNMRSLLSPDDTKRVDDRIPHDAGRLGELMSACLRAAGAHEAASAAMADALIEAHLRGVETHGLRRLRPYIGRIRSGGVDAAAEPAVDRFSAMIRVDGRNAIGHYVARRAVDEAIAAARQTGIAIALVRNSNHFGFAGYYSSRIAQAGQIGIVISNGQVCVAPEGRTRPFLSNNPLAISAPTGDADSFLELDLATSVTSRANIVQAAKDGQRIPAGWAQDNEGKITRDSAAALEGSLLALAGDRGFGLLFALEAMTGVLAGGAYADLVSSKESSPDAPEGTGHTIIAIDLKSAFGAAEYKARLDDMISRLRAVPGGENARPVRYPGERRWRLRQQRLRDGIPLSKADADDLMKLAAELGVVIDPAIARSK
jgi:LDH2 family malate/lactate/ureidoglycolate dehydrogenase